MNSSSPSRRFHDLLNYHTSKHDDDLEKKENENEKVLCTNASIREGAAIERQQATEITEITEMAIRLLMFFLMFFFCSMR